MFSICLLFKIALIMFRSDNKLIFFLRKKTTRNAIFENRVNRIKISIQCTWPSKAASIVLPVVKPVTLSEDEMFSDRFLSLTILQLFLYDFFSCMRWFWNDFFFLQKTLFLFYFLVISTSSCLPIPHCFLKIDTLYYHITVRLGNSFKRLCRC